MDNTLGLVTFEITPILILGASRTTITAKDKRQAWQKFTMRFGALKPDPKDYVVSVYSK